MFAKINHVAMASANYALVGKFYEVLFGLKTSRNPRPEAAVAVGVIGRRHGDMVDLRAHLRRGTRRARRPQ